MEQYSNNTQDDLKLLDQVKQMLISEFHINSFDATKIAKEYVNEVGKGLGVNTVDRGRLSAYLRLQGIEVRF